MSDRSVSARKRADQQAADWSLASCSRAEFVDIVREQGAARYRDLPWRNIDDPYGVLVSEVMLQQTQVARVLDFWPRWMGLFPTVDALAAADSSTVLQMWQGLGYNRRALALKRACEQCAEQFRGTLPASYDGLLALPGVGPATAAGVMCFARNEPAVYIETNVRAVFLHHLFPDGDQVKDRQLEPYVADTCPVEEPRGWYYALLDYGAFLKTQVANPSRRSASYARQSAFAGSWREKRSFVLKCVLASDGLLTCEEAEVALARFDRGAGREPLGHEEFERLVDSMVAEGFFDREQDRLVP